MTGPADLTGPAGPADLTDVTPSASFDVEIPEGRLRGEESGSGTAVVLIHGLSFDRSMWDPQVAALADRYRVIRYDLRGFGRSGAPAVGLLRFLHP